MLKRHLVQIALDRSRVREAVRARAIDEQQTILTEHWRVVFRRHYFTSRAALDRSLQDFLRFYNVDRPHHGYRLRGRTPATVFHGAVAAAR